MAVHDVDALSREVARESGALPQRGDPVQAPQRQRKDGNSQFLVACEQRPLFLQAHHRHVEDRGIEPFRRPQRVQLRATDPHVVDAERHADPSPGARKTCTT